MTIRLPTCVIASKLVLVGAKSAQPGLFSTSQWVTLLPFCVHNYLHSVFSSALIEVYVSGARVVPWRACLLVILWFQWSPFNLSNSSRLLAASPTKAFIFTLYKRKYFQTSFVHRIQILVISRSNKNVAQSIGWFLVYYSLVFYSECISDGNSIWMGSSFEE